jgi:hypothetical protein
MAQITSVTSEALQKQIRDLLPSQQGFGEDLQASNVILPIIDLTSAAAGTSTPLYLQQALAFGSQTAFSITATTTVIVNTPGFYRIFGVSSTRGAANADTGMSLSDGLSTKQIYAQFSSGTESELFDFTVFLRSGDSLSGNATGAATLLGSSRQVADVNGNLVYPVGYTPQ